MTQVTKTMLVPGELAQSSTAFSYSPGVLLAGGRLVICSGQVGWDADGLPISDPTEQYVAAFENVRRVLAEARAGLEDVVELVTFHTSFDGFELFTAVKNHYLPGPFYPAWTGIGVAALALPGLLVEIKATALVS